MVEICSGNSIVELASMSIALSIQGIPDPGTCLYMLGDHIQGYEQPVRLGLQSSKSPAFFLLILQVDANSPFLGERGVLIANTDEIPLG